MTEPTLRDMYRWSGGSQSAATTLPSDTSQPTAPTSASGRALQTTAASQPSGDSDGSSEEAYWYLSGPQYTTPHQPSGGSQQYFNSSQEPTSAKAVATRRQESSENQPQEVSQTSSARQRLSGGSQLPSASRSSDDRPRYNSAPLAPAISRPHDEAPRHTSGPDSRTLTQTSGNARRPSSDKPQYASIVQKTSPQRAASTGRRSDRYSSGVQAGSSQPAASNTSRPYDDRHRYNVRTSDERQRFSNASTIAAPASARQSEDKQRYSSGAAVPAVEGAVDNPRTSVPASTSASATGATATARGQSRGLNIPRSSTTSKTVVIDDKATSSDNANASKQTYNKLDTPVNLDIFCTLFGIPQGKESNVRQAAEALEEGRTPTSAKPPTRTSTGKSTSSIAPPFKVRSRGPRFCPRWLRRKPDDSEYDTSLYYGLIRQETKTRHFYWLCDLLTYSCLIAQLIISAALIILGAINGDYHIPVAILGAATGLITGILSLIRGQGLPQRLMQYEDGLRRVRENIEFTERELRAEVRTVTYGECVQLRMAYENVREDETKNHPDVWTSWNTAANSIASSPAAQHVAGATSDAGGGGRGGGDDLEKGMN